MHSSRLYRVTMDLFTRPEEATAVATFLILSPANSFALPAAGMASKVAAAAARVLCKDEICEARPTQITTLSDDQAGRNHRALFESDGWSVIAYTERTIAELSPAI